ncbi:MAG: hypothetical protein K8R23_14865 [Chthoniobacter sp.]|nr:hypothetical protein [Chthoniobacter sp.]
MTSPLLALFVRSLREDTRAKSTYWARAGLAAFMLVVMGLTAKGGRFSGGATGLAFLKGAAWFQTVFLTISGLGFFASAITEEKEEGTLGLLRMTNLSPLSILLGKSTSRLAGSLLLLGAQVPFTLVAVTLGGVSTGQVLATYATLGAYAFLLCNLALLASVIMPRTVGAVVLAGGVLGGALACGAAWDVVGGALPFHQMRTIFRTGFAGPILGFQVVMNLLAGLGCFLLAWLLFHWRCESATESAAGSFAGRRWLRSGRFAPGRPERFHAIEWKDYHFLHGGSAVACAKWIACGIVVVVSLVIALAWDHYESWELLASISLCGLLGLVAELGLIASRLFATEVREQTLSSLALLPQSMELTVQAKSRGYRASLAPWGVGIGCAGWLAFLAACIKNHPGQIAGLFFASLACGAAFLLRAKFVDRWSENRQQTMAALGVVGSALVLVLLPVFSNDPADVGAVVIIGVLGLHPLAMIGFGFRLTAYLSLRMKRGALPLAVVICGVAVIVSAFPLIGWIGIPAGAFLVGLTLRKKTIARFEDLSVEN